MSYSICKDGIWHLHDWCESHVPNSVKQCEAAYEYLRDTIKALGYTAWTDFDVGYFIADFDLYLNKDEIKEIYNIY